MANQNRSDPIHATYYAALHRAEQCSDWAFYVTAVLSLVVLFVDQKDFPRAHSVVNIAFMVGVGAVFVLGLGVRLYWMPRADKARLQDFFSKAYDTPLTHMQTVGYYNNDATEPVRRVAAMTMENAFFSKSIALKMLHTERPRVAIYALIYFVALANRTTDIGLLVGLSQIIFSEQVLVKWIKLEWLRNRFEETFDTLRQLFQVAPKSVAAFRAHALSAFGNYEAAKANAALTLSNGVFNRLNPVLSAEWDQIRAQLHI